MDKYNKQISKISSLLSSGFQRDLLNASFKNLSDDSNPLSFNNFAYSMRELSIHILDELAPDDEVVKCEWFNPKESYEGKPSRRQKIKYAIQGVLKDAFVDSKIIPIEKVKDRQEFLTKSIAMLSKYTHVNEDTFDISLIKKDKMAEQVISSLVEFAELIQKYRKELIEETESFISDNIFSEVILDAMHDIQILSTHYEVEDISFSTSLNSINTDLIIFDIQGFLVIRLQWGSDGDLRRGDGHEHSESFPFTCEAYVKLGVDDYSSIDINNLLINTDQYLGIDEEVERMIDEEIEKSLKKQEDSDPKDE